MGIPRSLALGLDRLTITLVCPPGAADSGAAISYGDRAFPPYRADHTHPLSPWLVDVPDESAVHFCHTGGFRMLTPPPAPPAHDWVLMHHATDPAANPPAGSIPEPNAPGHWWIARVHAAQMAAHGFIAGMRAGGAVEPKADPRDDEIAALKAQLAEKDAEIARVQSAVAPPAPEAAPVPLPVPADEGADAPAGK